ncbi:MAG: chromosome segregation protein SMC [Planctomycetota bacterium]|nr:chromosome segregation protein SMC [Planctomycetota bacterium]
MKLRKLILHGFKSFADRTTFDFDEGVSCVVGPNGCGKSNIVDAVKWVLGTQSAKSLRGSEMMDVVFNGSAGRRAASMAEVTLVFDNGTGVLQPNVKEDSANGADGLVSVSRQLFRSGQSKYLINKTPCRLKDVREMFMDTGIGIDAYSLIEQGRVEMFLQASQDERRAIFDEAAGISKYKARKAEAIRKLQRVEQNLLRLNDILAEVEKQLRSVKYQAGKARNYQTYTERLKDLRSLYFLAQYHSLNQQRTELQRQLDADTDALSAVSARIDQLEAARSATEVESVDLEQAARGLQGRLAAVSGQIATCRDRTEMLSARVKELGEQIVTAASRCEEVEAKLEAADADITRRRAEADRVEAASAELTGQLEAVHAEHTSGEKAVVHLQARLADEKAGTIDLFRRTAQLHNEIHTFGVRRETLHGQEARLTSRAEEITETHNAAAAERAGVQAKLDDVAKILAETQAKLDQTQQAGQRVFDEQQQFQRQLAESREARSALASRMDAIREMQARMEGIAAGARRVVEARRDGRCQAIRGMLCEFLSSDLEHAPVVEAALAGADQQLLAMKLDELTASADELNEVVGEGGSVEVICLDRVPAHRSELDISACPQAVSRAIDLVRFEPWLEPVMQRLLGRTLVVRTLADAVEAAAQKSDTRFVTLNGEVLEADGRVRIGAANRAAGIITRRSELAELQTDHRKLDEQIDHLAQQCDTACNEHEHLEQIGKKLRTAIYEANTERVECKSRLAQLDGQIEKLQREQPLIADDLKHVAEQIVAAVRDTRQAEEKAGELEKLNRQREQEIVRFEEQIAAAQTRQRELAAKLTELKVALAQSEEKKQAIREALSALARQRDAMQADLSSDRSQIDLNRQRRDDAKAAITAAGEETDRLCAEQTKLNVEAEETDQTRHGLREKLEQIRQELTSQRRTQEEASEKVNTARVELSEADVRIENLIARASDEMNMALLQRYADYSHDEARDWDAVEAEITELRGKIERLGNVNLDAIAEQDELQQRREFLSGQLDDVNASRKQLDELIRRINTESRQRFTEMFEKVRANFQDLFRKLFGGGRADIVLLDDEDVLESGIEIVARPPGKELRSLSLLSGGEKTMTALALLFSIFKSKPSPFCLLDEVDAALDEANTERFANLLQQFVHSSQFIIISHAKRTMGMSNVLYGVTMQEPGVSKRISVRFEDVGHRLKQQLEPVEA